MTYVGVGVLHYIVSKKVECAGDFSTGSTILKSSTLCIGSQC
jgi:hypothetical protein